MNIKLKENLEKYVLYIFSFIAIGFILYVINMFRYGFDFTDESVHLFMMERSEEYPSHHILTGFLYQPFYRLFNGNIFILRTLNFILFFLININLCRLLILKIKPKDAPTLTTFQLWAYSLLLAFSSLSVLIIFLPTPNYNLLNFMGISIVATGVLIISSHSQKENDKIEPWGWIICALGIYITFMSRIQTTIAIAILLLIWAILSSKFKLKYFIPSTITLLALVLITIFLIDSSLLTFIERFKEAIKVEKMSNSHEIFLPITFKFDLTLSHIHLASIIFFPILLIYVFIIDYVKLKFSENIALYFLLALIPIFINYIYLYKYFWWYEIEEGFLLLVPLLALIIASKRDEETSVSFDKKERFLLFGLLLLLAVIFGLGSNNSIFIILSLSCFFIVLGLLVLLSIYSSPQSYNFRLYLTSIFTLVLSMGIVYSAIANPYRQPFGLWLNNAKVNIQEGKSPLILREPLAQYISNLQTVARENLMEPNTPIIDLSGRVPGSIYILNGYTPRYVWATWISNDIEGARRYISYILSTISCEEISRAWLLVDDYTIVVPIEPELLMESGLNLDKDYIWSQKVSFPKLFSHEGYVTSNHYLLKPSRNHDDAIKACYEARRKNSRDDLAG